MGENFLEETQELTCYGCKHLIDTFGNYVECGKTAENGIHMFVDWFYWNTGSPKECPLRKEINHTKKSD